MPDGTKHDGTVILKNITRSDVLRAIKEMNKKWTYRLFEDPISEFNLVYKRKLYPLTYLISYAYKSENGFPHDVFDQNEAQEYLTDLGFTIENLSIPPINRPRKTRT